MVKLKSMGVLGSGKGWRNEPIRHGLARKGVKTGKSSMTLVPMTLEDVIKNQSKEQLEQSVLTMSQKDYDEHKDAIANKLGIKTDKQLAELKALKKAKKEQNIKKAKEDEKQMLDKFMSNFKMKEEFKEIKKAQRIQKLKERAKQVTRVIGKGLHKATSVAEYLTPEKPRIRHEIDLGGRGGVKIKRRDLELEEQKRREAERVRRQTMYLKNI